MHATRRQFLSAAFGASVVSLAAPVPRFLLQAAAREGNPSGETVLVVIQLSGGNDGLNTVIPYADDVYRSNRKELAIGADQVLKIDDYLGLHPSMRGMADLLELGRLAVVQGVGYPNPNRSHFEAMDIWHTCRRKDQPRPDGWIGRYLDAAHKTAGRDVPALHLGTHKQPFALMARDVRVPSVRSLDRFRLQGGDALRAAAQELAAAERPAVNGLLGFVQSSTTAALEASQRVEQAAGKYDELAKYPTSELAQQLRLVAQLIDAGMSTRVYYLEIDGFDTHANQPQAHAALLEQVSSGLKAFLDDVAKHGHGERVAAMCFSEFGRRLAENASQGTDHGAAGPIFVAGARVQSGLIGKHPSLTDLDEGDLKHHTDFRQVYAALLAQWLGWESRAVLDGEFEPVNLFKA
jgi:uncharacterized protein (DUF1501 family)